VSVLKLKMASKSTENRNPAQSADGSAFEIVRTSDAVNACHRLFSALLLSMLLCSSFPCRKCAFAHHNLPDFTGRGRDHQIEDC
jgi:hypothetical protein